VFTKWRNQFLILYTYRNNVCIKQTSSRYAIFFFLSFGNIVTNEGQYIMMNHLSFLMRWPRDAQQISCLLSLTCQIKKKRKDQSFTLVNNQCYSIFTCPEMLSIIFIFLHIWWFNICSCDTHIHSYSWEQFSHATNPAGILIEPSMVQSEYSVDFLLLLLFLVEYVWTRESEQLNEQLEETSNRKKN
jgi:hypothetical protein